MRQKALRSFPNRYLFSLYHKVTSSFSIRYILEIISPGKMQHFIKINIIVLGAQCYVSRWGRIRMRKWLIWKIICVCMTLAHIMMVVSV